ncbi:DUF4272 domain-containing protein [Nocardia sp. Marseille-Q1738]
MQRDWCLSRSLVRRTAEAHFFLNRLMEDIYEQHGESAGGLDPMLVAERCYALHWIACAGESEWDADEE